MFCTKTFFTLTNSVDPDKMPHHAVCKSTNLRVFRIPVLDLDLLSIASLGPRPSTKAEFHVIFTESQKVKFPN